MTETITEGAEAPATVTVAFGTRPDERWEADALEVDGGALVIGAAGLKGAVYSPRAIYAPGHWMSAGLDAHRAEPSPDDTRLLELETAASVLREVEGAAYGELTGAACLDAIRGILTRHRCPA